MRLLFFVVWKSWASNRLRTVLTCLGVALGVAIVTAIHVVDHNTIQSRIQKMRPDFGRVDLELVPLEGGQEPSAVRARLAGLAEIKDVGLLHQAPCAVAANGKTLATAQLFGLSPRPAVAFAHYRLAAGKDLSDLDGDDQVLVGAELASELGVGLGDALTVAPPRQAPRALCKNGVLVPIAGGAEHEQAPVLVHVKGILAHAGLARRSFGEILIGSFGLAQRLAPQAHTFFQVNLAYGSSVDRVRQLLGREFQVLDDRSAMLGEAADERAFRNGVKVLGCLALVLGMFVVFQTLSQSLVERLGQIGLLRCLGASRRAVAGIFLVDALALACLGALLGVGLGIALAWVLQAMDFSTLGVGKKVDTFQVPLFPVLWTACLGVLFTLAGAAFPLVKARNLPALRVLSAHGLEEGRGADVLRGVNVFLFVMLVLVLPGAYLGMTPLVADRSGETLVVLGQLGGMILLFGGILLISPRLVGVLGRTMLRLCRARLRLPAFLVGKALRQSAGRFAASVCGLAVVLLALLALKHITAALRAEVRQFGARTMAGRLFLEPEPVTPAQARRLAAIQGVVDAQCFEGRVQAPFLLAGLSLPAVAGRGCVLEPYPDKIRAFESTRSLIVSRRLAQLRALQPGDDLAVLTDQGPIPYKVLLVSDDAGFFPDERAFAVAAPKWLRQDFCVPTACVGNIVLRLAPGASWTEVLAAARAMLPNVPRAKFGDDVIGYEVRDVTRDFVLFDVLLLLILLLAGVGLVNQMTIAAMGRVREIGVLRALGVGNAALRHMFLLEGCVVATLSALLALVLGVPLGAIVVHGLNRVSGLDAPLAIPWRWFAIVPLLAFALGWIGAAIPAWRTSKESPAEAVRYE